MALLKDVYVLMPRSYECCLTWQKGFFRCDTVKDPEMRRLPQVTWVGPV